MRTLVMIAIGLCFLGIGIHQVDGLCTYNWCNSFCQSRGFPTTGCVGDQCKCGQKAATDCSWCDNWCAGQGFPPGGCQNGQCKCGSRQA